MRTLKEIVPIEYDGCSVNDFLRCKVGCSGTLIKALKRQENGITLNGKHARTVDRVQTGDTISLSMPEKGGFFHEPVPMELEIIYQDHDIMAVNKPSGLPVHQSPRHHGDTLANGIANYFREQGIEAPFRAVNRLDRDTSGLVLLGLNSFSAARLAKNVQKVYYALVDGIYKGSGTVDLPIRRQSGSLIKREVGDGGQPSVTHWKSLGVFHQMSFLEIRLETGRTHQIRVHFSHLGTPVVGDTLYGGDDPRIPRQALHCGEMEIVHPATNQIIQFKSPLPEDIKNLLK